MILSDAPRTREATAPSGRAAQNGGRHACGARAGDQLFWAPHTNVAEAVLFWSVFGTALSIV